MVKADVCDSSIMGLQWQTSTMKRSHKILINKLNVRKNILVISIYALTVTVGYMHQYIYTHT